MADYIDREEAIRVLSKPITMSMCVQIDECKFKRQQRETDLELIKSFPAADVQPVKHGQWIQLTQNAEPTALKCSLCGEISCCHGMYCPDCGARMDGDKNG